MRLRLLLRGCSPVLLAALLEVQALMGGTMLLSSRLRVPDGSGVEGSVPR